jgi:ATP-dependent Clp protease protease subunit
MNQENKLAKPGAYSYLPPLVGQDYIWVSEFTDTTTASFLSQFKYMEANPAIPVIPIYIHSYGGDAHSLLAMRDIIKSSHKPVATIALGMAMSCGVLLLAAGTKGMRFAAPSTQMMVHEASWVSYGKAADISENAKSFERLNEMVYVNFAKDTNIPLAKIKNKMKDMRNADWYLEPNEAIKWGIIDHIAVPRIAESMPTTMLIKPNPYDEKAKKSKPQKPKPQKPKPQKQKNTKAPMSNRLK